MLYASNLNGSRPSVALRLNISTFIYSYTERCKLATRIDGRQHTAALRHRFKYCCVGDCLQPQL